MNRPIRTVAVLGSGVMGSRIAALFAGIGVKVLLLDIAAPEPKPEEAAKAKGGKNRIVQDAYNAMLKSRPAAVYSPENAKHITTGNFDDDMPKIADADWIIEVVIENLDIKKQVFEKVEKYRKPGTIISSNTSGIPIHLMSEGRS